MGKDYWDELSGNEDTREMVEGIIHELKVHESSRRGTYLDRDSKGNRIVASSLGINARGKFSNIYKGTTVLSEEDASRNLPLAYIKQVMIKNSKLKWALDKFKGDASGIFSSAWQYGMGVFDGINKDQDPTLSEVSEQVMGIGGYHQSFKFVARNFSEHAGEPALKENSSQTYSFEGNRGEAFKDYYNGRTGIVKNGLGIRVIRTNRDKKPSGVAINETGDVVSKVDLGYMFINKLPDTHKTERVPESSDNDVFRLKKNSDGEFVTTIIRENGSGEFLVDRAENGRLTIDETPIAGGLTHDNLPQIIFADDRENANNTADTFLNNHAGNAFFRQYTTPNGGTRHEFFGANSVLIDYTMKRKGKRQPGSDI